MKIKIRKCAGILMLWIMCIFVLTGCEQNQKKQAVTEKKTSEEEASIDVFAMDTYMTLKAYGKNAKSVLEDAKAEIQRLDQLWSVGNKKSEIYQLNQKKKLKVSEETLNLIEYGKRMNQVTGKAFDITIYPLMDLWGFTTEKYKVPTDEEINEIRENQMGTQYIKINKKTCVVTLEHGIEIDLGGIAKGYTSQKIAELMEKEGVKHGVISLGGNVQSIGTKTDGSRWKVGIQSPDDSMEMVGAYQSKGESVITSGAYERYFEKNGTVYHHILDPSTGKPSRKNLTSVTIISKNGTLADTLSTSLFIMGKDKAIQFWRNHSKEFQMILVDQNDKIYISQGIQKYFTSDYNYTVVKDK